MLRQSHTAAPLSRGRQGAPSRLLDRQFLHLVRHVHKSSVGCSA